VTKIVRGNPIRVRISGSETLEADFVILTVSLGVLKSRAESLFDPALPSRKLESIRTLAIGSVDKAFLEFEDVWWNPEEIGVGFAFMFAESGTNIFFVLVRTTNYILYVY
jgi:monoamine oxidase